MLRKLIVLMEDMIIIMMQIFKVILSYQHDSIAKNLNPGTHFLLQEMIEVVQLCTRNMIVTIPVETQSRSSLSLQMSLYVLLL